MRRNDESAVLLFRRQQLALRPGSQVSEGAGEVGPCIQHRPPVLLALAFVGAGKVVQLFLDQFAHSSSSGVLHPSRQPRTQWKSIRSTQMARDVASSTRKEHRPASTTQAPARRSDPGPGGHPSFVQANGRAFRNPKGFHVNSPGPQGGVKSLARPCLAFYPTWGLSTDPGCGFTVRR